MEDTPDRHGQDRATGAMWSRDDPQPTPIHMVNIGATDGERIRDLEEGQRDHEHQLIEHGRVLADIRKHLGELVDQFTSLKKMGFIAVVIIFAGTTNGSKFVELIGQLFS